jgi:hypothetical protein
VVANRKVSLQLASPGPDRRGRDADGARLLNINMLKLALQKLFSAA